MHGGKSTGPKTAEGKQRVLAAITKHGFYTKKAIAERREARLALRHMKAFFG